MTASPQVSRTILRRSYGLIQQFVLSPYVRLSHTAEASTPFERIKRHIYSYKEVLSFLLPSSHYTTHINPSAVMPKDYELQTYNVYFCLVS